MDTLFFFFFSLIFDHKKTQVDSTLDLSSKVVIVTGPTSGIGTETARVLALRGAHVILAARSSSKLSATKTQLEKNLANKGIKAKFT